MNALDLHVQAGAQPVIFVPNRDRARRRALILRQLAAGRRRRKQYREAA
ncbi:hypothetical protein ACIBCA_16235 [Kitasatospora sp. NPDC051170]